MATDSAVGEVPQFIERGERDGSGWDYYACPCCETPIASFCDCPDEDCGWYDADAWRAAIRQTAQEYDDIYTGSLRIDN